MSIRDLIAKWQDALAEAQLVASLRVELSDEDLEAAAATSMRTATSLRAGRSLTVCYSRTAGCGA